VPVAIAAITAWFTAVMGAYKEIRIVTGWVPATAREGAGEV
jgi:hypothetical protein